MPREPTSYKNEEGDTSRPKRQERQKERSYKQEGREIGSKAMKKAQVKIIISKREEDKHIVRRSGHDQLQLVLECGRQRREGENKRRSGTKKEERDSGTDSIP